MAKLFASEAASYCTWAALQTLGGWGYSREYPVEKWVRDARARGDRGRHLRHSAADHQPLADALSSSATASAARR